MAYSVFGGGWDTWPTRFIVRLTLFVGLLTVATGLLAAPPQQVTLTYGTAAHFNAYMRDGGIDVHSVPGTARLVPYEYYLDDIGYRIGNAATQAGASGKKVYTLDTAGAPAKLYIYRAAPTATFNGTPITFTKIADYMNWSVADIPAGVIRQGANEFIMAAGFSVPADLDRPARNSFVSHDGGATWQPARGEFLAHLRVAWHPRSGVITSDVIDLANPQGDNIIAPMVHITRLSLEPRGQQPAGTAMTLEARTGDTPWPDRTWSAWTPAARVRNARFVQWRANLTTTNRRVTPVLESVVVQAHVLTHADAAAHALTVENFDNQRIVRTSIPFTYQTPSEKLDFLRTNWRLDEVIAPGRTEMEQLLLLRNWVRLQWPHNEGGGWRPWDAINVLTAPAGDRGMCSHFGVVFTQCALALGFNARQVILRNHYVSEAWSNELQKWVLMDVETVQPEGWKRYGTAIYLDKETRTPLSGLEIHRALVTGNIDNVIQLLSMTNDELQHEDYDRTYGPEVYGNFQYLAYPIRNNYLDQLEPWEVAHGVDHYHCDEYIWWKNGVNPVRAEYSRHTDRDHDLNWTLQQAAITLTATRRAHELDVTLDTVTPNLQGYLYRINGGAWQFLAGDGTDAVSRRASFTWTLAAGANTLEVKTRNLFDREGVVSSVTVRKP